MLVLLVPQLLCTMGEACRDFLRKRVSESVMPKIASYLVKQAETSMKAGPNYTQSLNFKLQLAYLQGLGPLCISMDLGMSHVILTCFTICRIFLFCYLCHPTID